MELEDILKTADAQKLQEIEQQRATLLEIAEAAVLPEVRQAYEIAIHSLDEAMGEQAQSPILQTAYATYGREELDGLSQIAPLENILPEDQVIPLRNALERRVATASEFFEKYGMHTPDAQDFVNRTGGALAVSETVEVKPFSGADSKPEEVVAVETAEKYRKDQDVEKLTSAEKPVTELSLIFRDGLLQIGKQGKIVPLNFRQPKEGEKDYSQLRKKALIALVANQGSELRTQELKEVMSEPDLNKDELAKIRRWLLSLTYRRQPLVQMKGIKRGAKYSIAPHFKLEVQEITTRKSFEGIQFTKSDLYVAARHLEQFNPFLEEYDIPAIDCEMKEALREYAPDLSQFKGNTQAIWSHRQAAYSRAAKLLESEEEFFRFLDQTETTSAEYKFVDMLFGLEAEQRQLLGKFMNAKIESETLASGGTRLWAIDINDKNNIIAFVDLTGNRPLISTAIAQEKPAEDIEEDTAEVVSSPQPDKTRLSPTYDYGEVEAPKRARLSRGNRQRLDTIRMATEEIVDRFLTSFNPEELYKRDQLATQFRTLTTRAVATAMENNVGPSSRRGHVPRKLNIHDVVNILLYSDPELRNIYGNSKLRKQVRYVIAQTVHQRLQEQAK